MDAIIFCGGRGTRLSEKTHEMPKPLIELGEYPILWHIMKIYSHYDVKRFVLALGYKGEMITEYFLEKYPKAHDFSISFMHMVPPVPKDDWFISFVQTGVDSKTARRLMLCEKHIHSYPFMLTYGDGVADIDINALSARHEKLRKELGVIATITITRPYTKYGIVRRNGDLVGSFREKPLMDEYINAGFMVVEREVFSYINPHEDIMFEDTLQEIAKDGKLGYYVHDGFWHAMDTFKDYEDMNRMWRDKPKWKVWKD